MSLSHHSVNAQTMPGCRKQGAMASENSSLGWPKPCVQEGGGSEHAKADRLLRYLESEESAVQAGDPHDLDQGQAR
jgi:hypothetical protein